MSSYQEVYDRAAADFEGFWAEAAQEIDWFQPWTKVLDRSGEPFNKWFVGAETNTCYNCVDRHVKNGRADQIALIYDSPVTNTVKKYTYAEVLDHVSRLAGAIAAEGVTKGDRVIIYMPMIPEAAFAMLACARLGAIHSVVFGGFASKELATRIDDAKPKLILSASCGIEGNRIVEYTSLLHGAVDLAENKPDACLIFERPEHPVSLDGIYKNWAAAVAHAEPVDCTPVLATDPSYVLYTSGTTGVPKGVVRDTGGHMVALKWSMKNVYDIDPGEVFWAASDVGWVVGHSYIVYAPLLHGCTTILFEGKPVGTPDPGTFWRVIQEHGVVSLFTAPTAFRAIRQQDPEAKYLEKYDISKMRVLYLAGERCDTDTLEWSSQTLGIPVIDHWWQTELGWPCVTNPMGIEKLPVKPGSPTKPLPGYDMRVLDENGKEMGAGEIGSLALKLPLLPGTFATLWENPERFRSSYFEDFPGYYKTGDAGYIDEDGYVWVMARTDDIINVAGHRLSTGGMEDVLAQHPDVAECAVLGISDALKGQVPLGLLVLKNGANEPPEEVQKECIALVREKIGPVAAFKLAVVVPRLPKTRSGKILRATIQKIADGEPFKMPATIDDPAILDEIAEALKPLGYAKEMKVL
ncbi:MAG: propionyl-CoA synthetase [Alphaproteobacteria bacterium]|nr:propionyl-CoA synthetase [Alphaproteobacteria bacterium]